MQPAGAANSFNAVRLLAALQVGYHHAVVHLHIDPLPGFWWVQQLPGVPVFFAVSGYLVFGSLLRLQSVPKFCLRRLTRIYPGLLVNIAVIEIALTIAGQTVISDSSILQLLAYYVGYGATADSGFGLLLSGISGGLHPMPGFFQMYPSGVLWTLTVELTFYAVTPLFGLLRARPWQTAAIATASLASFFYQQYTGITGATLNALPYFWMFGMGMLFRLWQPRAEWSLAIVPLVILLFVVIAHREIANLLQFPLLCLSALWIGSTRMLKSDMLAQNDISYGIYLYHMLIVTALVNVSGQHSRWLLLVVFAGSILLGIVSWKLIEQPVMRLVRSRNISTAPRWRASHCKQV